MNERLRPFLIIISVVILMTIILLLGSNTDPNKNKNGTIFDRGFYDCTIKTPINSHYKSDIDYIEGYYSCVVNK